MSNIRLSICAMGLLTLCLPLPVDAAVPAVGASIGRAIAKYFGKEGSQEASEYLTMKGGQEILERVGASAARQGGDEAVEQVAVLVGKHGPDALAALDNAPSVIPVINALDELPEAQVKSALSRLAAGSPGRELAEATTRFGAAAIKSELKHPGVGLVLVRSLGDDGAELASRLTTDQAIAVGRHADDIARLPDAQRSGVLSMLRSDTERVVAFAGRFVEANPGKSLFTVATTAVILAEPERILGGDEVVFDADGHPILIRKPGLAGEAISATGDIAGHVSQQYLRPLYLAAVTFVAVFATLWITLKLWQLRKLKRLVK